MKQEPTLCCLQETHFKVKNRQIESEGMEVPMARSQESLPPGPDLSGTWPLAPLHALSLMRVDLSQPPIPLHTCRCWQPGSHATSAPCPHWGRPKCSKAVSGADPCGQPICRGGAKTTAKPQGPCNQGIKAEISPHSCTNHELTPP